MQHETVIVLDFGGQYNQLIARRVRENNVYCEIYSYKTDLSVIKAKNPKGIIFTGGPNSVYLEDSPTIDPEIFSWGVPVLGICYGSQLMMHLLGGHVCRAPEREYGKTEVFVDNSSKMFTDVQPSTVCWMSHNDYIEQAAPGFKITAHTVNCPVAAAENAEKGLYAVQFHPEVLHTQEGTKMLHNFVRSICGCEGTWRMDSFVEHTIKEIRENIPDDLEIETFVHGALCVCYSGQCLFSSIIGGRSGNRGKCAQPCRLPYTLLSDNTKLDFGYLLSPKDLCGLDYLPKLISAGVTSLKIEGRMKSPVCCNCYKDL